ncbi:MAG: hypothetical protein HY040_12345 [Planctomycetes bacterium]|nr:hypothetical protein [Planctomycetota bacterium]
MVGRVARGSLLAGCLLLLGVSLSAQQPQKSPVLPPINPAVARLDQTISGLDGLGLAIAFHPGIDILVAGC